MTSRFTAGIALLLFTKAFAQTNPATTDIMLNITNSGNRTTVQVKWPSSYSNRIEIFACENLASNGWHVESGKHTTIGKTEINWTDNDSDALPFRAYRAGDADTDTDLDSLTDAREILVYGTSATTNDTDGDLLPDDLELDKSYLNPTNPADAGWDYDDDGATNLDEYQFGTRMWDRDTDNDGLSDQELYHWPTLDPFNALASDRIPDTDGDGIPNGYEADNKLDAFDSSDKFGDRDNDGLDNYFEYTNGLFAGEADSDGDGLNDRAEITWGMTDPMVYDDPFSDADGDGLLLVQEYTYGSNPSNAHSDTDGVDDGTEAAQGSQPADASDGGNAPPAGSQVELTIEIGDHSESASESYTLYINDIPFASVGTVVTHTYMFNKGQTYTVRIEHDDTSLSSGNGDHDYTAHITATEAGTIILEDNDNILGIHGTANQWDGYFDADGLEARLHIPKLSLTNEGNPTGSDSVVFISAAADMPEVEATLLPGNLPVGVAWDCSIVFNRPNRNDNSAFAGSGDTWGLIAATGSDCYGGKASLSASSSGVTLTNAFHIRGENPTEADVEAEIGNSPFYAKAMARHESGTQNGRTYLQFNEIGSLGTDYITNLKNTPNRSSDGIGWGIFQLSNPAPTINEVWNWTANIAGAMQRISVKETSAQSYFNAIQRTYPNAWEPPPASYTPPTCVTSLSALQAATIQLFNGASVTEELQNPYGGFSWYGSCWKFHSSNPTGQRWEFIPNSNNYVKKVILEHEN